MTEEHQHTAVRRDRFSDGPARAFLSSMDADERIFAADLAVDRAHTVMLAEQGIIEASTAGRILVALETVESDGYAALPDAEDVHEAIETKVIAEAGEAGGAMHTARSRNDEVATCIRVRMRSDVLALLDTVVTLREVLAETATEHRDTLMPGYTHMQPAQPITVAHWACSYERALARDTGRLLDAYDRINRSPLGGAAFAGTTFPIDRERTAALLGFDGVVTNAMDAAAGRDVAAEGLGAAAILAGTLSGLAEDVVLFAHRGFLDLDDDYASTSSIMPQKKNPDTLELVRATAGDATGGFVGLLTTLKGLPRAYNRDLQGATPHVWRTMDATEAGVVASAGAVGTATWNAETLADAAGEGFATATGVADHLARSGLPFRSAHDVVAAAAESDEPDPIAALERAAGERLDDALWTYADEATLASLLDPEGSVAGRDSPGGPAPSAMDAQVETIRASLDEHGAGIEGRRESVDEAARALAREVDQRV